MSPRRYGDLSILDSAKIRPDIQGLRGLAVLAVVAYHAQLPLSGGFVGVDMFFVISGWVVTNTVIRQVSGNSFSIISFYSKRIKRLVPMLTLVNLATLVLIVIFLSPFGEIQKALSTVRWSTFFSANIELLRADTYSNLIGNPFRHLWSLAVEEQFYLFYPVLVFVVTAINAQLFHIQFEKALRGVIAVILLISFAYCLLLSSSGIGSASIRLAFFSMPSRMWEFACGIILATYGKSVCRINSAFSSIVGVIGILLLLWSFTSINSLTVFPGWATIAPVVGTIFLLLSGDTSFMVKSLLSIKPLTYLGDISYGWYLWHWPLIVMTKIIFPHNTFSLVIASLAALMIAHICFVMFENPIRRSVRIGQGISFLMLATSCVFVFCVATGVQVFARYGFGLQSAVEVDGTSHRDTVLRNRTLCSVENEREASRFLQLRASDFLKSCSNSVLLGQQQRPDIILVGDSQADSYADGLFKAGSELGLSTVGYSADGCPFIARAPLRLIDYCNEVNTHALALIAELQPKILVITNRYDFLGTNLDEMNNRVPFRNGSLPEDVPAQLSSISSSLSDIVNVLGRSMSNIVVVTDLVNPSLPPRTLFEKTSFSKNAGNDPYSEIRLVRDQINVLLQNELGNDKKVTLLNFDHELCDASGFCSGVDAGKPIFVDENHLNATGSRKLTSAWVKFFTTKNIG